MEIPRQLIAAVGNSRTNTQINSSNNSIKFNMNTNQRNMSSSSVKAIMSKRSTIPAEAVGKRVKFFVQGNGNTIDVKNKAGELVLSTIPGSEGIVLQKRIYNLRANSAVAMRNERTRQYLIDGLAAEKAGDTAKAHELFNEYLNSVQMSFGVLLPAAVAEKLTSGVEIAATVIKVDTDNGSLLTIDPSTIGVVEPESYGSVAFNLDEFTAAEGSDEDLDDDDVETPAEKAKRLKREAKLAAKAGKPA